MTRQDTRPADASSSASLGSERLKHVIDVSRMLAVMTDLDPLLVGIAESVTKLIDCERASIFLHDRKTDQLYTRVALGSREIRVPSTAGIVGQAFQSNAIVLVPDPYSDPRFNREPDLKSGFVTRNLLTAPMVGIDHKPVGVIQAVNRIGGDFEPDDLPMMQMLADQAGVAIQRHHLQQDALASMALRREMDLAKKVQQAMIPKHPPEVAGILSTGWTHAASTAGGDSFDLWTMSDGRLGVFVGDASGHGIGPALVVSQVRTLIRTLSEIEPDPAVLLERVNDRLSQDLHDGEFITAFLGYVHPDGTLTWVSAGHAPVLLMESPGRPLVELVPQSHPIGILPLLDCDPLEARRLEPGGTLLVTSDGIIEAFGPDGEQYGLERLCRVHDAIATRPVAEIAQAIRDDVIAFQTHDEPTDDQTVVVVRRQP